MPLIARSRTITKINPASVSWSKYAPNVLSVRHRRATSPSSPSSAKASPDRIAGHQVASAPLESAAAPISKAIKPTGNVVTAFAAPNGLSVLKWAAHNTRTVANKMKVLTAIIAGCVPGRVKSAAARISNPTPRVTARASFPSRKDMSRTCRARGFVLCAKHHHMYV